MIPVLNPAGVQEVLDYGLYGWAMSRFTGTWVALKTMHETIESTAAIDASLDRINIVIPTDFQMPEGGLNIRLNDPILDSGSPPARFQARRHARVRARQQAQPHHHLGRPPTEDRHHHHGQKLPRCPPGVRRARHRRNQMQRARHPPLQGRLPLAAQPPRAAGICPRARPHHCGRGEAFAAGSAGARGALRHPQSTALHRQEGRAGQLAFPGQGRARSQRSRDLHRRPPAQISPQRRDHPAPWRV